MSAGKAKKGGSGAPAWIVTFADLMSLLLTFFVLLLSFSNMEVTEFKKMAGAMGESFGLQSFDYLSGIIELEGSAVGTTAKNVAPIFLPEQLPTDQVGPDVKTDEVGPDTEDMAEDTEPPAQEVPDKQAEASKRTFNDLETVMATEIAADVMDLIRAGNATVVRFPDKVSFPSGSGEFKSEFLPILSKVLSVLEESKGNIIISGHTDDVPITTDQYRSNWDLSSSRAASVAHYILKYTTISPDRITVQGYADSRPLVANENEDNRAKNRRVEITIEHIPSEQVPSP